MEFGSGAQERAESWSCAALIGVQAQGESAEGFLEFFRGEVGGQKSGAVRVKKLKSRGLLWIEDVVGTRFQGWAIAMIGHPCLIFLKVDWVYVTNKMRPKFRLREGVLRVKLRGGWLLRGFLLHLKADFSLENLGKCGE
ncbi:MAG: hypothetical protein ACAH59_00725 [Pseudobdellovibrionaceae bacterium]